MANNFKYVPFLKLKGNEVSAYVVLDDAVKQNIRPFFDLPTKKDIDEEQLRTLIKKSAKKLKKYLNDKEYYLDNIDIPDAIDIDLDASYKFVLSEFADQVFIPVVGVDRDPLRNNTVFDAKKMGAIKSNELAIRVLPDEFYSFDAIESELIDLKNQGAGLFDKFTLIVDARLLAAGEGAKTAKMASDFINKAQKKIGFDLCIFTGSSIPASISELVKTEAKATIVREELIAIEELRNSTGAPIIFGDYTIVSPYYSDLLMPAYMLLNVTAPRYIYSFDNMHYIIRGGGLKTHHRGYLQYNDLAHHLTSEKFYRGVGYSAGDKWLSNNINAGAKKTTPGTALVPTINSHITFMCSSHPMVK